MLLRYIAILIAFHAVCRHSRTEGLRLRHQWHIEHPRHRAPLAFCGSCVAHARMSSDILRQTFWMIVYYCSFMFTFLRQFPNVFCIQEVQYCGWATGVNSDLATRQLAQATWAWPCSFTYDYSLFDKNTRFMRCIGRCSGHSLLERQNWQHFYLSCRCVLMGGKFACSRLGYIPVR